MKKFLFEDVKSVPYMEFLISDMDIANFKPDTVLMIAKKFMEINGMQRPIPLESPGIVRVDSDSDGSELAPRAPEAQLP
ncbi:Protein CBG05343 [Caenorhabditis briggsae]|uniref:Protein CBG05343 n=1 Tax=Caenorhabditis briggsae TaxID=6238 RepID=A8WZM6_CAEBR|nr:Protein CBG05343 [Caenorhabditis briggsae]CAP25836.1 Protein CBG05343 [Caenorhabditis briggsae]